MSTLDRYIARQYLTNILVLFVVLFAFVLVIDFSLNFDEFVKIAQRLAEADSRPASSVRTGTLAVFLLLDLWWPRLFLLFGYLLGLVLVGAMGFTCTQMVRHREFVAILAGGMSLHRVARPMLIVAACMLVLQGINREVVLPGLAPLLTRDKQDAGKRELGVARRQLASDSAGRLFYAQAFDLDTGSIDGLWVWERDAQGLMTSLTTASSARWAGGAWRLAEAQTVSRLPARSTEPTTQLALIETDLDPAAFRLLRYESFRQNLSSRQIGELILRYNDSPNPPLAKIDAVERVRWGRYADLFSSLLTLCVALAFYLRREPTNMLIQSLYAAPIAIVLVVAGVLGTTAAIPGLPPQLAVFIPVIAQIPLAIVAYTSVRT